jgi:hypothetical protein
LLASTAAPAGLRGVPRSGPGAPHNRAMKRSLLAILTALALLAPAGPAPAAGPGDLYDDCQDGRIDRRYSQATYQRALREIPADVDEYTDCRAVIRRAQLAAAGGRSDGAGAGGAGAGGAGTGGTGGPGGGSGGTGPAARIDPLAGATAAERQAVQRAAETGAGPLRVGGEVVRPGERGIRDAAHDVPTPLLVLLALLAAGALASGGVLARSRVVARRAG